MYASDITRTFPVSGQFTAPQRDLYEAVLSAQKECVKRCKIEDEVSLNDLHRTSTYPTCMRRCMLTSGCVLLNENLRQIGFKLSPGDVERKLVSLQISSYTMLTCSIPISLAIT
jgi:intermediate cleaving peptidase 55